jgi:hypothetical protein
MQFVDAMLLPNQSSAGFVHFKLPAESVSVVLSAVVDRGCSGGGSDERAD